MRTIIHFLKIMSYIIKSLPKILFLTAQRALYTQPYRALCHFQLYHTKNYQRTITSMTIALQAFILYHTKNYNSHIIQYFSQIKTAPTYVGAAFILRLQYVSPFMCASIISIHVPNIARQLMFIL